MKSSKDTVAYMITQIRYICGAFQNRAGGSKAESDCQRYLKAQMEGWSDAVEEEAFRLHPKAFLGWIIPAAILNLLALLFYWLGMYDGGAALPALSFACAALSLIVFLFEFVLYRPMTDFLYPRKCSLNIFARRKPMGDVRRRIIFGGHADAAYEMTYLFLRGGKYAYPVLLCACAGMLFVTGLSLAALISALALGGIAQGGAFGMLGVAALAFAPAFIAGMFFINWGRIVDGANDNLSGCLVSAGILREMKRMGLRLKHTEVCCLVTGGEEEGLRGAAAFAKRHRKELLDVETVFIALDTLREVEELQVYTRGMNGTQKGCDRAAALVRQAAKNCGVTLKAARPYPGAMDSDAFSREGISACGLGGVSHTPQGYYHTRHDTADNLDEACIRLSLDICMEAARLYDGQARPYEDEPALEKAGNM